MTMTDRTGKIGLIASLALALSAFSAFAMSETPKASAAALGITKGKSFDSGLVFVEGKFIPPPYVVERWGTCIRINRKPVTGQIVDWSEFVKTQSGVKVTKSEESAAPAAAPEPEPAPAPAPAPAASSDDDSSLDDLFDDDPKPKKAKKPAAVAKKAPPATPKPKTTVTYSFDGEFVHNDQTKAMVKSINAVRTEIDMILRKGGFICFGESYSRVNGDARTANELLEKLPELMQRARTVQDFKASVRSAQLYFLSDTICDELFRNRIDYRALQEHRAKLQREREFNQMLKGGRQGLSF